MNEQLRATLDSLPHKPGIYIYKDENGVIIYVGKATSLASRARSYFQESANHSLKTKALVSHISDMEYIVVGSPTEALILENEYIKKHQPKYNIRLRDDKTYPYIKIALQDRFPRVYRVRSVQQDGARYFGPYPNIRAIDTTLDLLNKIFPFRTCRHDDKPWAPPKDGNKNGWKLKLFPRPCAQYAIHRCNGPCVAKTTPEEYGAMIQQIVLFLEGKLDTILDDLRTEMAEAAEQLEFERAAVLRDRVEAVESALAKQKIINTEHPDDRDVIALATAESEACAQIFFFRGGKLAGRENHALKGTDGAETAEIMASFLQQYYEHAPVVPGEILVEYEPADAAELIAWLKEKRGGSVAITQPKRGDKLRLVEMASQNAQETLELERARWLSDSQKTALALAELQEALQLSAPPARIECYDISSIQGSSVVGSMVVFEHGKPKNADYRRFSIKTVNGADDYASHQEMLRRRFKRLVAAESDTAKQNDAADGEESDGDSFRATPDLIVIDGGRGHLNADRMVMEELGIYAPLIGVAKENHGAIGEHEEIYLPDISQPIILPRGSQGLYLLQRIRDEAHRFAITYHRQKRSQKAFASTLDDIPGIGPKRKKALLKHFGSLQRIAEASAEDLAAVEGMTRDAADRVLEYIGSRKSAAAGK